MWVYFELLLLINYSVFESNHCGIISTESTGGERELETISLVTSLLVVVVVVVVVVVARTKT